MGNSTESLTPSEYVRDRVEDQIKWYDAQSVKNKRGFIQLQILTLSASAAVPVVAIFTEEVSARVVVAILGSATAISTGLVSLFQFRENWIQYRSTAESLKHEKYMFQTRTGPYVGSDAFNQLVERIEGLVSQENTKWQQTRKSDKRELEA